jgi:hypothetical protein
LNLADSKHLQLCRVRIFGEVLVGMSGCESEKLKVKSEKYYFGVLFDATHIFRIITLQLSS